MFVLLKKKNEFSFTKQHLLNNCMKVDEKKKAESMRQKKSKNKPAIKAEL